MFIKYKHTLFVKGNRYANWCGCFPPYLGILRPLLFSTALRPCPYANWSPIIKILPTARQNTEFSNFFVKLRPKHAALGDWDVLGNESFELTRQMNTGGSTNELIIRHLNSELFLMFKSSRLMNSGLYGIKNTRQMNSVNKL